MRDETLRDKLIREEQIDCRYFTGIQNKCCEAGVNYDQLTEDGKYVLPCKKNFVAINRDPAICGSFKTRTLEEDWSVVIARWPQLQPHTNTPTSRDSKKEKAAQGRCRVRPDAEELCVIPWRA